MGFRKLMKCGLCGWEPGQCNFQGSTRRAQISSIVCTKSGVRTSLQAGRPHRECLQIIHRIARILKISGPIPASGREIRSWKGYPTPPGGRSLFVRFLRGRADISILFSYIYRIIKGRISAKTGLERIIKPNRINARVGEKQANHGSFRPKLDPFRRKIAQFFPENEPLDRADCVAGAPKSAPAIWRFYSFGSSGSDRVGRRLTARFGVARLAALSGSRGGSTSTGLDAFCSGS